MNNQNKRVTLTIMSAEFQWGVKDLYKNKDVYAHFEYDGVAYQTNVIYKAGNDGAIWNEKFELEIRLDQPLIISCYNYDWYKWDAFLGSTANVALHDIKKQRHQL